MNRRLQQIVKMRKTNTLKQIGKKFSISAERVRQLLVGLERKFCQKHRIKFIDKCKYCVCEEGYEKFLKNISKKATEKEAKKLSGYGRGGEIVIQRRLLVKKMKEGFGFNFSEIGRMLKRDRTTVSHLYHNSVDN